MIAMSFNLLQEEVINSVKSVGRMLGIVKENGEDEEYWTYWIGKPQKKVFYLVVRPL